MAEDQGVAIADKIVLVPIEKLRSWEKNPRRNDHAVDALADSIGRYGMNVPLLINKNNHVIAGNTRLKACQKLGLAKVPCLYGDHLTIQQQQAFNVADNKIASLATWDDDLLLEAFKDQESLLGDAFSPELLGFTQAEFDVLANGWTHDGALDSMPEESGASPGKLVISGPPEHIDKARAAVAQALAQPGLAQLGFVIK